jgi:hypothetical protein
VRRIQKREWVDRLEATVEAHILPVAKVREACAIPGTSVRTAFLCRDKPAMKEALREAGVPCAQSRGVASAQELRACSPPRSAIPLILKPRSAAGASGTVRVDNDRELESAIVEQRRRPRRLGGGRGVHRGARGVLRHARDRRPRRARVRLHYYPGVLEAMRTRWISPQIVTTNRVDAPGYAEVKQLGQKVIEALGIGTSATHMEWFFGPKGLKFSEIGCRPPGVGVWDLYAAANDFDIYRISGYQGIDEVERVYGEWILDSHLPPPGTRRNRSRPATWPTPGSACATPTTTSCAACSTSSAVPYAHLRGGNGLRGPRDGRLPRRFRYRRHLRRQGRAKIDMLLAARCRSTSPGSKRWSKERQGRAPPLHDRPRTAVDSALAVFIAVGTPPREDGSADLSYVVQVAESIADNLNGYKVVVTKSTVPIGTGQLIEKIIRERNGGQHPFSVVSNPEFLREGSAIEDFMRPDRVVIGARDQQAIAIMKDIYSPLYRIETPS